MRKLITVAFAASVACVAIKPFLPDIQRYLRIRNM